VKFRDRASGALSNGMATWKFLIGLVLFLAASVVWNIIAPAAVRYDPYPFILLNLFMSALAAVTAPILLMAANRQAAIDRQTIESADEASEQDLALDKQALDLIQKIASKMEIE
jgi:uncharacterized membrane protein